MKIKYLLQKLKEHLVFEEPSMPEMYKTCPECDGTGYEDIFIQCEKCKGECIVRKSYKEYVDSLPVRS